MKGFSLVELIIALGIISAISVASVYIVFLSLNLRDLTIATTTSEDSLRVFNHYFRQAILGAEDVTGGGNNVYLRSPTDCYSFVYDPAVSNVRYSHISLSGCSPEVGPANLFFSTQTKIDSLSFIVVSLATGGRQVIFNGDLRIDLPFDTYQTDFSGTYINLID